MKKLLFMCPLGLLFLVNCKKDPPSQTRCGDSMEINEIKNWVLFKPGTYWIYEEENSLERDTVRVTSYYDTITPAGNLAFNTSMYSSFDRYYHKYYFNESFTNPNESGNGCVRRRIYCTRSRPGDYEGGGYSFVFPLEEGSTIGIQSGGVHEGELFVERYPLSSIINGQVYPGAVSYHVSYAVQFGWKEARFTLAQNVGIIRKENLTDNKIWNLVEYRIVQ